MSFRSNVIVKAIDTRVIASMRFTLAASIYALSSFNAGESTSVFVQMSPLLFIYVVYSAIIYILSLRHHATLATMRPWSHWVDVGFYGIFVLLSPGNNYLYFFFLFAVLVASLRFGFTAGLSVTGAAALILAAAALFYAFWSPTFDRAEAITRIFAIIILGYLVSYVGGYETTLKRRLALLKEITRSNPRYGIAHTIGTIMAQLRDYYSASACILIVQSNQQPIGYIYRAENASAPIPTLPETLTENLVRLLVAISPAQAVVYNRPWFGWTHRLPGASIYDLTTGERASASPTSVQTLATLLDTDSFITVPIHFRNETFGRLYLTSHRRRIFDDSNAQFLIQVIEHITPLFDNMQLIDSLAADAAEEERRRIALDIHDSVIQPYIGMRMGLAAVARKLEAGQTDVHGDIEKLIEMANVEIADLRRYVHHLKHGMENEGGLLPAVQRFATKFSRATGIAVDIESEGDLALQDRIASEAFQIITEGLSNVRRHTQASHAIIGLARHNGSLTVRIENDGTDGPPLPPFTPRSIMERALALGGRTSVQQRQDNGTAVIVRIPLAS